MGSSVKTIGYMNKLLTDFISDMREVKMRQEATISRYSSMLKEFIQHLDEKQVRPERVDKATITNFLRQRPDGADTPSKSIWNLRLASLRAFFQYLYQEEVITMNPALRIDRIKTNPKESIPLNLDEYLALVEVMEKSPAFYHSRNTALVQVMFHSALRVTEVISLDLHQVDFQAHLFMNVRTKGDKHISLPFPDLVSEALERYTKDRETSHGKALFLSNRGTRMSVRAVQRLLSDYGRKAGITRPVTPHLLRHSGATELADLAPLRVVQEILGHSSPEITQRYVHVAADGRRLAINALGKKVARHAKKRRKMATQAEASNLN